MVASLSRSTTDIETSLMGMLFLDHFPPFQELILDLIVKL